MARLAWVCLAGLVALFRGNAMTPDLTSWRDQQWQELHQWAVNPSAQENLNLKYNMSAFLLLSSGALLRLFTANLTIITIYGLVVWAICLVLVRRYSRATTAIGGEVDLGAKGLLAWSGISFAAVYAFLVFITGALLSNLR